MSNNNSPLGAQRSTSPRSMTGFGRQESQHPWGQLVCEIRSVNHRYLEPSLRLPDTLRSLEPNLRERLKKSLGRGKIDVSIQFKADKSQGLEGELNGEAVNALSGMLDQVNKTLNNPAATNAFDVLNWPGVLQANEVDPKIIEQAALEVFELTLAQLQAMRAKEGNELSQLIEQRLVNIAGSVEVLRKNVPGLIELQRQKLRERIENLKIDIDEERFAQEIVYLAQKADVDEELDRLEAHIAEVRATLKKKEPIGRRLDFLMQELNREANTLGSKSVASECSQAAVDLKVWIEQMREQVQNIE